MDKWMQSLWPDHLDLARCAELIAKEDMAAGVVALSGSLTLLQCDLLKLLWTEEITREKASAL